ncbi:MAG: hypothetical protein JSW26_24375, partial [Desulfobacterales bacterium]
MRCQKIKSGPGQYIWKIAFTLVLVYGLIFAGGVQIFGLRSGVSEAKAADTGFKTTGNIVATGAWTNFTTTALNSSDANRASVSTSTSYGVCSTYAFGVPGGATIDGIEVAIEGYREGGIGGASGDVELSWNNGSNWTTAKTNSYGTTETTYTYGGAADTWGRSWSSSEFSDANFQLRVYRSSGNRILYVNHIQIKVYYTATGPQYTQASFRARNDNGSETSATWTAAANTNWTQMVDKTFRLRFLVQDTGSAEADKTLQLEYNLNSGGWNDVTGSSSVVKATA